MGAAGLRAISIFMPAYNVARHVERTVGRIPPGVWAITRTLWIVNDGSTDSTAEALERLARGHPQVRVVTFPANRGYGEAVREGLLRARGEDVDAAVCLHADGQYAPEEIPRLLDALAARRLDLVQGSRIASGTAISGGMPLYKYVAGRVLTAIENAAFRSKMTDYHSGFLCYGGRALSSIPFERLSASYDFDLEAIACARARGLRVGEVPVTTHYGDEKSNLWSVPYGFRVLGVVARYLTGRYAPARKEPRA